MISTTIGRLLIDDALPSDLRGKVSELNKKGLQTLFNEIAEKHPEKYRDIAHKLMKVGADVSYTSGGYSFGLRHMLPARSALAHRAKLESQIDQILDDPAVPEDQKQQRLIDTIEHMTAPMEKALYEESLAEKNPLALQVASGAKGSPGNLRSIRGADLLYLEPNGRKIPIPVTRSYSEGLTPAQYFAGTFGARSGLVTLKLSTADAGYFCLAAETRVRMADLSTKAIKDITEGDFVLGADALGATFPVRVSRVFENGVQPLWRYKFRFGQRRGVYVGVTATAAHRMLSRCAGTGVAGKWPLEMAKPGFQLIPAGPCSLSGEHEPRALLLGLMLGDGGISQKNVQFSAADAGLVAEVNKQYHSSGWQLHRRATKQYEYTLHQTDTEGRILGPGYRNTFRTWLVSLGLAGCRAYEKFVPAVVQRWDTQSLGDFIGGLFSTDGCVAWSTLTGGPALSLTMTSRAIIRAVSRLLRLRFGIYTVVRRRSAAAINRGVLTRPLSSKVPNKTAIVARRSAYTITFSAPEQVRRFAASIPLVGIKRDTLADMLARATPGKRRRQFGFGFVAKAYVGLAPTYDLEVEHPDHLFVLANGMVVSNSKVLGQAMHRLIVTAKDGDQRHDPNRPLGLPVPADDPDNEGGFLAAPIGPYPRNTQLTPKVLADIKRRGVENILIRSPIVGGPPDGGIYQLDAGVRDRGRLAPLHDIIGLTTSSAIGEPISQGTIGAKHLGGVAGAGGVAGGFKLLDQLAQVPETFPGGAAHAQVDGKVESIEPAAQGGHYITVGSQRHYMPQGQESLVKPGQTVEAGDRMSNGIPNPEQIVAHKHIGEGRRQLTKQFYDVMRGSNMPAHRRNIELLARGLINHVRLLDEVGDHVPDEVVPYSSIEHSYEPRKGHVRVPPKQALGKYLEQPVLHYTIGTKVRPSMLSELEQHGVKQVIAHHEPPPFVPEMVRAKATLDTDPDWMTRMLGSNQEKHLLRGAHRADVSDPAGTSYVPGLAQGLAFGTYGKVQGWKPEGK